jgi:hypothetical protein
LLPVKSRIQIIPQIPLCLPVTRNRPGNLPSRVPEVIFAMPHNSTNDECHMHTAHPHTPSRGITMVSTHFRTNKKGTM